MKVGERRNQTNQPTRPTPKPSKSKLRDQADSLIATNNQLLERIQRQNYRVCEITEALNRLRQEQQLAKMLDQSAQKIQMLLQGPRPPLDLLRSENDRLRRQIRKIETVVKEKPYEQQNTIKEVLSFKEMQLTLQELMREADRLSGELKELRQEERKAKLTIEAEEPSDYRIQDSSLMSADDQLESLLEQMRSMIAKLRREKEYLEGSGMPSDSELMESYELEDEPFDYESVLAPLELLIPQDKVRGFREAGERAAALVGEVKGLGTRLKELEEGGSSGQVEAYTEMVQEMKEEQKMIELSNAALRAQLRKRRDTEK